MRILKTSDLSHAKQVLYHSAIEPIETESYSLKILFISIHIYAILGR